MLELAGNPALVERLGREARRFAEGLTWERTARETWQWIETAVRGGQAGRGV
jgi:glycosyltransferase involved in cell wall biosynthesis